MNHILGCNQFTRENLEELLELAEKVKNNPKEYCDSLKDKIIAVMFFEPSTRTRMSFESAIVRLGGRMIVTENGKSNSSATKGETLEDSIKVINGYADAIVMRHSCDESAEIAASVATIPVINAGSGKKEHPTQSLLDMFTIREKRGTLDNLKICFLGDLKYGRTVHSLLELVSLYNNVEIYGLSKEAFELPQKYIDFLQDKGITYKKCKNFDEIPKDVDVLYHTRIQAERFEGDLGVEEYIINKEVLNKFSKDTIVLHPLPRVNEISTDIDDDERAMYFKQAHNGVPVRMSILLTVFGIN